MCLAVHVQFSKFQVIVEGRLVNLTEASHARFKETNPVKIFAGRDCPEGGLTAYSNGVYCPQWFSLKIRQKVIL